MERNNQMKMIMESYLPAVSKICIIILIISIDRGKYHISFRSVSSHSENVQCRLYRVGSISYSFLKVPNCERQWYSQL